MTVDEAEKHRVDVIDLTMSSATWTSGPAMQSARAHGTAAVDSLNGASKCARCVIYRVAEAELEAWAAYACAHVQAFSMSAVASILKEDTYTFQRWNG